MESIKPLRSIHRGDAFRTALLAWYQRNGRALPWRRTSDPYAILVSEFMLQQTTVATVIPRFKAWLDRFPNFETLAAATEPEVLHAWQGLGYYARARNLHGTAKIVVRDHAAVLPRDVDRLRSLPGCGEYTASAIAAFAYNKAARVIDTNIGRVVARLFDIRQPIDRGAGRAELLAAASALAPRHVGRRHHSALMDLGALICVAREPKCNACPVRIFCRAKKPNLLPLKRKRPPLRSLAEFHQFRRSKDRVLLERCSTRWRGMWMLPQSTRPAAKDRLIYASKFPFTHHTVILSVHATRGKRSRPGVEERWFSIGDLGTIPVPSPHRRALNYLLGSKTGRG